MSEITPQLNSTVQGTDNMTPELAIIITVINLIAQYGVPAAVKILNDWNVPEPTVEDFLALNQYVKDPESYFNKS